MADESFVGRGVSSHVHCVAAMLGGGARHASGRDEEERKQPWGRLRDEKAAYKYEHKEKRK